jgi:DNA polymerase-3 subunit beta
MKIGQIELSNALVELEKIAKSARNFRICQNVKMEAKDGILSITATDLDRRLTYRTKVDGDLPAVCINAKMLNTLVAPESKKTTKQVEINLEAYKANINVDGLTTKINVESTELLPESDRKFNQSMLVIYPSERIKKVLEYVSLAASTDTTRYQLGGVCFKGHDIVATDGHRLHIVKMQLKPSSELQMKRWMLFLPKDFWMQINAFHASRLRLESGPWKLSYWKQLFHPMNEPFQPQKTQPSK